MSRRARRANAGFSLVELMIVVALVGILAALALSAFGRNRSANEVDNWVKANRDAVAVASRRAVATQQPYMVQFTATSVKWCRVATVGAPPTYSGSQTTCSGLPVTVEQGRLDSASNKDARSAFYWNQSDIILSDGTYSAPSKSSLAGSVALYFGRNGAASTNIANVMSGGIPSPANLGFTLYVRRFLTDDIPLRRRLIVYGLASKTRIIDNY